MESKAKTEEANEIDEEEKKSGRLSENTISYFKRVEQVLLEDNFDDDEHKETFLRNVYAQIEDDTTQLLRHTLTSKVLEKIIPLLNDDLYIKLCLFLTEDIEVLCSDRFASHVVETMCKTVTSHIENELVIKAFVKLFKCLRGKVDVLLRNIYGSHVLSTLLQVFSGVQVAENITKSRNARESKKKNNKNKVKTDDKAMKEVSVTEVPKLFLKQLNKMVDEIIEDDNFGELLCHRNASPVLQVVLLAASKVSSKRYDGATKEILARANVLNVDEEDEDTLDKLPVVLTDEVGSHLFEVLLQSSDAILFDQLTSKCFSKIIVSLSLHHVANYLTQMFLRLIKDENKAQEMVGKLLEYAEDILANGHMGCIARISETIVRLNLVEKQKIFVNIMSKALHIPTECTFKPLIKLLLSLRTFDMFYKVSETEGDEKDKKPQEEEQLLTSSAINYHGANIVKNCFSFKKSKTVVESFLTLTVAELIAIGCHPNGSFSFESFYQSSHIPSKRKDQITETLLGSIELLASEKFGSRIVDAIWKNSDSMMKEKLQSKLRFHKVQLSSSLFGRIVLSNCELSDSNKQRENKEREDKKRKFVEAIVPLDTAIVPSDTAIDELTPQANQTNNQPQVKKKKNDDRASKYREQLKKLGILIEPQVKEEEKQTVSPDSGIDKNLSTVIEAIEATTKKKKKKTNQS